MKKSQQGGGGKQIKTEVSLSNTRVWGQCRIQLDLCKQSISIFLWGDSQVTLPDSLNTSSTRFCALFLLSAFLAVLFHASILGNPLCEGPKGKVKAQHGCSYGNLLGWPGTWLRPGSPSKFFHSLTITPWIRGRTHLPRAKMTHKAKLCHWLRLLNSSKMGRNVSRLQLENDLLYY